MSKDEAKVITREELETRVIELLQEHSKDNSRPIAIAINGKRGADKCYMYRESLAMKIQEVLGQRPVYTSIAGRRDENAIVQDLAVQFVIKKKISLLKALYYVGQIILRSFGLSDANIKKKDLKNTIVCINNLESLYYKIPMQDIFGLISGLKENNGCHIILLYSESRLEAGLKDDFYYYKAKIVDFDFFYNPTPMEQLRILENTEEYKRYLGKMISLSSEDYPSIKCVLEYFCINELAQVKKLIFDFNSYCKELEDIIADAEQDSELVTDFLNLVFAMIASARIFYLCGQDKKFVGKYKQLEYLQEAYKKHLRTECNKWGFLTDEEQRCYYTYEKASEPNGFFDSNYLKEEDKKHIVGRCTNILDKLKKLKSPSG